MSSVVQIESCRSQAKEHIIAGPKKIDCRHWNIQNHAMAGFLKIGCLLKYLQNDAWNDRGRRILPRRSSRS
jgi:hypothetical protein